MIDALIASKLRVVQAIHSRRAAHGIYPRRMKMDDQQGSEAEELAAMRTYLTRIAPHAAIEECRAMMYARLEPALVEALRQAEGAARAQAVEQAQAAVLAEVQALAAPAVPRSDVVSSSPNESPVPRLANQPVYWTLLSENAN